MWHVLDANSIWIREFVTGLSHHAEVHAWSPQMRLTGAMQGWERGSRPESARLWVHEFPMQRGYARFPLRRFVDYGSALAARLAARQTCSGAALICTTPFYAPVA